MELILWRHAEAEDTTPDSERSLTRHGRKQAERMAEWLKPRLPGDTRILVSPARRTRETADALELPYTVSKALAPDADPMEVLKRSGWPGGAGGVLIVGHQPTLGQICEILLTGKLGNRPVKKGDVWWFTNRIRLEEIQPLLRAVIPVSLL
jgi:phosphohistidine phosphatase